MKLGKIARISIRFFYPRNRRIVYFKPLGKQIENRRIRTVKKKCEGLFLSLKGANTLVCYVLTNCQYNLIHQSKSCCIFFEQSNRYSSFLFIRINLPVCACNETSSILLTMNRFLHPRCFQFYGIISLTELKYFKKSYVIHF
jgi:hypothetical protein